MRPTVTMTVFGCFAEMTTPTFVLPWKRRHPVAASPVGVVVRATVVAVRLRTVTCLRALTAADAALPCAVRGADAAFTAADETRGSAVAVVAFARAGAAASRSGFFAATAFA